MLYLTSTQKVNERRLSVVDWWGKMNEKFFDLKKEKQDRMINGALKVFAQNGYAHASTDDIVKEAGISKGLLFHYFVSKLGLYSFVYDYSVRYMMLELSTGVSKEETDYFELILQIRQAQMQVMKTYPYMVLFLNKSRQENVSEALLETEDKRSILPEEYAEIIRQTDVSGFANGVDPEKLNKTIEYMAERLMEEHFLSGSFQPELYFEELKQYLLMLKKLTWKEA